ncbi:MAG: winged helix-turn-helix transcriptional regulator, partial [Acinetobacter junii]
KVEYSLTELGHGLEQILIALKTWGDAHLDRFGKLSLIE